MSDQKFGLAECFKDAVCIDAPRVYDSCCDRDCLEDLRVHFTQHDQCIIDEAISVRCRHAEIINVFVDVEPVSFNRGFFACDLTFFFLVKLDVFTEPHCQPIEVKGVAFFEKKVILFGSDGNVKVFSSTASSDCDDEQDHPTSNAPKCVVEAVDPVCLGARICEHHGRHHCRPMPPCVCKQIGDDIGCHESCKKGVLVTLGVFSIIKLIRNVALLLPVIDFCVPEKRCDCDHQECCDNPCDVFKKLKFPTDQFFPPEGHCCEK